MDSEGADTVKVISIPILKVPELMNDSPTPIEAAQRENHITEAIQPQYPPQYPPLGGSGGGVQELLGGSGGSGFGGGLGDSGYGGTPCGGSGFAATPCGGGGLGH
ncbi:unnamed protein product [Sphagnum tenellum]